MKLTPVEHERLLVFLAAELARRRRAAGLRLNHPEAVALITDEVMEAARAGKSYDEVAALGHRVLSEDDVMEGVAALVARVQVEPLFDDGTHLVTLHHPIGPGERGAVSALVPGEIRPAEDVVESPAETVALTVANRLDRAIQVTSHFHFFEVNRHLEFDRAAAIGMRLDVPAGMSVRFEPGETRTVHLRPIGGKRHVRGFHGLVEGDAGDPAVRERALANARRAGFLGPDR